MINLSQIPSESSNGAVDFQALIEKSGLSKLNELTPGYDLVLPLMRYAESIRYCDPIHHALGIKEAVSALRCQGVEAAGRLMAAAIKTIARDSSKPTETSPALDPWPDPVGLAELLNELTAAIRSYVVLPEHAAETIALWITATHAFNPSWPWEHFPILSINSAVMRSGKSLLLDVLHCLSRHAVLSSNASPAVLYRLIEQDHPEILIDEFDSLPEDSREELRNILNGAFQKGRPVYRCVGQGADLTPQKFDVFGPVAVASIGQLPSTVADRSIPIKLQRKAPTEHVGRFDRDARARLGELQRKAARWSADNVDNLSLFDALLLDENLPTALSDRARDIWRPLLAIAKGCGDEWLVSTQLAAVALSVDEEAGNEGRLVKLLAALKGLYEERGVDRLSSADIVETLVGDEGGPWAEFSRGQPLTKPSLARLLRPLGVTPKTVRIGGSTPKGYLLVDLTDLFSRYVPQQLLPATPATNPVLSRNFDIQGATPENNVAVQGATPENNVAGKKGIFPAKTAIVAGVAAKTPSGEADTRVTDALVSDTVTKAPTRIDDSDMDTGRRMARDEGPDASMSDGVSEAPTNSRRVEL